MYGGDLWAGGPFSLEVLEMWLSRGHPLPWMPNWVTAAAVDFDAHLAALCLPVSRLSIGPSRLRGAGLPAIGQEVFAVGDLRNDSDDTAQCPAVAVTWLVQLCKVVAAHPIALDGDARATIDRTAQPNLANWAHDDPAAVATAAGHRSDGKGGLRIRNCA